MSNNWPIAKFTFLALLCMQMVTLTLMLLIAHFGGEDAYLTHVRRLMRAVATESIQNVDNLLSPAESLVVTTAALMESKVLTVTPDEKLEQYLFENIRVNTNFSGMYFGWLNGDFLYVTRSNTGDASSPFLSKIISKKANGTRETQLINRNHLFEETNRQLIDDDYDPRKRPWFQASKKGSIRWTQPYVFHTSQQPGVTVSIPVVNSDGEAVGVLGLDIEVNNLSSFLSKNELSANSQAMMATEDHRMVAHTDLDLILKPDLNTNNKHHLAEIEEMDDDCIDAVMQALEAQGLPFVSDEVRGVEFEHEGERHFAVFHSYNKLGVNWTVIVISPESDFISSIRNAQFWQIISAIIGSLLITLVAFFVVSLFLKPMKELQESVLRNPLTGLYNRRALDGLGVKLIARSQSKGQVVSIAIIDIDRFKAINDTFGHAVGDEVLVSVSQRMQHALKRSDLLIRYGGEEFVILLFGANLNAAKAVCERLRVAVNSSNVQTESGGIPVTVSIGVSEISPEEDTYRCALDVADQALFVAKRNGRDRVCIPSDRDFASSAISL